MSDLYDITPEEMDKFICCNLKHLPTMARERVLTFIALQLLGENWIKEVNNTDEYTLRQKTRLSFLRYYQLVSLFVFVRSFTNQQHKRT